MTWFDAESDKLKKQKNEIRFKVKIKLSICAIVDDIVSEKLKNRHKTQDKNKTVKINKQN